VLTSENPGNSRANDAKLCGEISGITRPAAAWARTSCRLRMMRAPGRLGQPVPASRRGNARFAVAVDDDKRDHLVDVYEAPTSPPGRSYSNVKVCTARSRPPGQRSRAAAVPHHSVRSRCRLKHRENDVESAIEAVAIRLAPGFCCMWALLEVVAFAVPSDAHTEGHRSLPQPEPRPLREAGVATTETADDRGVAASRSAGMLDVT